MRGGTLLLACALTSPTALAATAPPASPPSGVVAEEVAPGSAAARAGLLPGDLLLGWERAASPPANPRPEAGTIDSPFTLAEVEIEEAPRGAFRLTGSRGGEARAWDLGPGDWELTAVPRFQGSSRREYGRGRSEIAAGRAARGIARWQRLAAALARGGEPERAAWLYRRIAETEKKAGAWEAARATYERALAIVGTRSALPALSDLWRALAGTLFAMGQLSPATDVLERALSARREQASESLYEADILRRLGRFSDAAGDLQKAERQLSRTLALEQRLAPGSLAEARALTNLGIVAFHLGQFSAAEERERRALAIDERLLPDSLEVATDFINLGNLEQARGDTTASIDSFRQSLALRAKLSPDSLAVAEALYSLGRALLNADDPAGAAAAFRRSLAIEERFHATAAAWVDSLHGLGAALAAQHQYPEAERRLRQALAIYEKIHPGSFDHALALDNLAVSLCGAGRLAPAEVASRHALALFRQLAPGSVQEAAGFRNLALTLRRAGRPGEAGELYLHALASLEAEGRGLAGTAQGRSAFLGRFASYYRETVDLLLDLGRQEEAFGILERYRAQAFLALLAERNLAFDVPPALEQERQATNAQHDRLASQLSALSASAPPGQREELERQLAEVRLQQDGVRARIRAASPHLATLRDPQSLGLAEVGKALDPGTLLLSYSVGKEKSWLFAVGPEPNRLTVYPIALGEKALRAEVGRLRTRIEQGGAAATPEAVLRATAPLTDLLLRPAGREVAAASRLLVLPDGPLHLLPFPLLGAPGNGTPPRFLVEEKPLFTAASATVFAGLAKTRRDRGPVRLSAFGDPVYPAQTGATAREPALARALRNGLSLDPLPGARAEVLALRALFPASAEVFLGPEATEERAKAVGREASIVHFACHALLDERSPLDSGLVLSIPDRPREGQDNGLLQAWEVFEQVHLDADLVTLSACQSALGEEQGGEGLLGLTRAFQYAGAHSILASLWGVGDEGTAELMRRFYGYLKAGESKDEALRHAQADLLHGTAGEELTRPFHWAAFELLGDWR